MRLLGWIVLLCGLVYAGSWERITLGDRELLVLREPYDLYDSKGISARFYIEDEAQNLHYLHTLVLEDKTGGCSGKSIERGAYAVKGDRLILYHLYDRSGARTDTPPSAPPSHTTDSTKAPSKSSPNASTSNPTSPAKTTKAVCATSSNYPGPIPKRQRFKPTKRR